MPKAAQYVISMVNTNTQECSVAYSTSYVVRYNANLAADHTIALASRTLPLALSWRYPVKTVTGRIGDKQNGDNLIGDNLVISATDKVKISKKQQVKTATTIEEEEGREKKRREEEGRKIITN